MKIELTTYLRPQILVSDDKAARRDVRALKSVLTYTGFYVPPPDEGVTGTLDEGFLHALESYRRAHMVPFDDPVGPNSVTERVMNADLAEA
jgi:hypothetical protein